MLFRGVRQRPEALKLPSYSGSPRLHVQMLFTSFLVAVFHIPLIVPKLRVWDTDGSLKYRQREGGGFVKYLHCTPVGPKSIIPRFFKKGV